jgi:hypothetical protein
MKTNDKQQLIPEAIFAKAFCTHFKCKPKDIEIRMIDDNKEAFVIYQDCGYKISTEEVFRQDIEFALTDKSAANHIHMGCWIQAIKNTVEIKKVLHLLVKDIHNMEQAQILQATIQLGALTKDPDVGFWQVLSRMDKTGELVGSAIVATAQVYNGQGLRDDLIQLHIDNGKLVYNQIVGGKFETVYLEDSETEYPIFYIYSVDY